MIEKSLYENYQIDFSDEITPDDGDYLFIFNEERELYLTEDKRLPKSLDGFDVNFCLFIGRYNGIDSFVVNVKSEGSFYPLYEVYEFNHDLYHIAGKALSVVKCIILASLLQLLWQLEKMMNCLWQNTVTMTTSGLH